MKTVRIYQTILLALSAMFLVGACKNSNNEGSHEQYGKLYQIFRVTLTLLVFA